MNYIKHLNNKDYYELEEIELILNNKKYNLTIFNYDVYDKLKKMHNFQNEGLDIISKSIKNKKCWQPYQTQLISLILNEGNFTFIDIGCHIGYYSLLAHSLNNKVISIEDNKNYYNVFNKTI